MLSGCTIQRRMIESPPPAAPAPASTDDSNPYYLDQFLKTTTTSTGSSAASQSTSSSTSVPDYELLNANFSMFNESEVFNASAFFDLSIVDRYPIVFQHDEGFENELENTTDFKQDVEELFTVMNTADAEQMDKHKRIEDNDGDADTDIDGMEQQQRARRSDRLHSGLFPPTRESIRVKCHNAGKFFSSRERWWYIAIANCGSEKGLDVTYRFKMTNGGPGDFWHEHFSADEMCNDTKLIYSIHSIQSLMGNNFYISPQ